MKIHHANSIRLYFKNYLRMKTRFIFVFITILSVLSLSAVGCQDEVSFEGALSIETVNSMKNIYVYPVEDKTVLICSRKFEKPTLKASIVLNVGNYIVSGYTESGYLSSVAVQIRSDHTTKLVYDEDNIGLVVSK